MSNNPYYSFSTSETTFPAHSKNMSGCAEKVKPDYKDNLSFQQISNLSEPLAERGLNFSNRTERVGLNSSLLRNPLTQMGETSINNQSNFQLNEHLSSQDRTIDPKHEEEEKSNENLGILPERFIDESKDFEAPESHQDWNVEGSIKSDVENNTTDNLSDIPKDDEDESEAEDEEKTKLKETKEIMENTKGPVHQLIEKLDDLKAKVLNGKLLEAYNGLIQTKQENAVYFEEGHEDFFSAKFYETLILFLCGLYQEALPELLAMERFYEENKDYFKIEIDEKNEKLRDDDIGVLYHKIGKCYSELDQPQEGIKYLEKAWLKLEEARVEDSEKQPFLLMNCYSSLTQHCLKYGDGEKAKEHSQKALGFVKELKKQEWGMAPMDQSLARCYINCCDVYSFIGDQEKAQENLDEAKNFLKKYLKGSPLKFHHMGARIKRSKARIYWKKGQYNKAMELYNKAVDIVNETMPEKAKLKEDYLDELQKLREDKEKHSKNEKVKENLC